MSNPARDERSMQLMPERDAPGRSEAAAAALRRAMNERRCNGKDGGHACPARAVVAFVLKDRSIRPRYWCHVHAAQVREVMRKALKKGSWTEVPLQE